MAKKVLLGNEAIVRGALEAGVSFVTGYPGCPSAEIGEEFLRIAKKEGIYAEWATNEKVALESAIGASFSGLKSLINMKSFRFIFSIFYYIVVISCATIIHVAIIQLLPFPFRQLSCPLP